MTIFFIYSASEPLDGCLMSIKIDDGRYLSLFQNQQLHLTEAFGSPFRITMNPNENLGAEIILFKSNCHESEKLIPVIRQFKNYLIYHSYLFQVIPQSVEEKALFKSLDHYIPNIKYSTPDQISFFRSHSKEKTICYYNNKFKTNSYNLTEMPYKFYLSQKKDVELKNKNILHIQVSHKPEIHLIPDFPGQNKDFGNYVDKNVQCIPRHPSEFHNYTDRPVLFEVECRNINQGINFHKKYCNYGIVEKQDEIPANPIPKSQNAVFNYENIEKQKIIATRPIPKSQNPVYTYENIEKQKIIVASPIQKSQNPVYNYENIEKQKIITANQYPKSINTYYIYNVPKEICNKKDIEQILSNFNIQVESFTNITNTFTQYEPQNHQCIQIQVEPKITPNQRRDIIYNFSIQCPNSLKYIDSVIKSVHKDIDKENIIYYYFNNSQNDDVMLSQLENDILFVLPIKPRFIFRETNYFKIIFLNNVHSDPDIQEFVKIFPFFKFNNDFELLINPNKIN